MGYNFDGQWLSCFRFTGKIYDSEWPEDVQERKEKMDVLDYFLYIVIVMMPIAFYVVVRYVAV